MSEPSLTSERVSEAVRPSASHPTRQAWRRFWRHRPAVISSVFLVLVAAAVLILPFLAGSSASSLPAALVHDPLAVSDAQFARPNAQHWFGTDVHGRDLLARVISGARVSLLVGLVGAGVSLIIGVCWGAIAGYLGGRWDNWMMRVVDVLYSLPSIVFVIVLITTLDALLKNVLLAKFAESGSRWAQATSLWFLFVGLGAVSWLTMARIVRGQVLSLRQRPFVVASRALGASTYRILRCHILPNLTGIILVYLTLTIPAIILYESFLSFLGLGIQPPMASWGSLIAEGSHQLNPVRLYWWLLLFPALALVSTLLALNFVGDALRDAWDPRA